MEPGSSYRPSNGTEGMFFTGKFCDNCIHEKFSHTGNMGDLCCDILSNTMCFDQSDPEYPKEWIYDENGKPTCTAHVFWDWGTDNGEGNGFNEPPPPEPFNPNQLVMPFLTDDILRDHKTKKLQTA